MRSFSVLRIVLATAAAYSLLAACTVSNESDDEVSSGGATSSAASGSGIKSYVMVVPGKTSATSASAKDASAANADDDEADDETQTSDNANPTDSIPEESVASRTQGRGALVRPVRSLSARAACLLEPGTYTLKEAPTRSPVDPTFWRVVFPSTLKGSGNASCGSSGWVEHSAVQFKTIQASASASASASKSTSDSKSPAATADDTAEDKPGSSSSPAKCDADASFRPQFIKPVRGPVTGRFGDARSGGRSHAGIDIAAATGTPLLAPEAGRVIDAGSTGKACGIKLMLQHPNGAQTRFCHNSKLLVKYGDCVAKGQTIALVGNTGVGSGPHMHLEYYPSPTAGASNPAKIFGY